MRRDRDSIPVAQPLARSRLRKNRRVLGLSRARAIALATAGVIGAGALAFGAGFVMQNFTGDWLLGGSEIVAAGDLPSDETAGSVLAYRAGSGEATPGSDASWDDVADTAALDPAGPVLLAQVELRSDGPSSALIVAHPSAPSAASGEPLPDSAAPDVNPSSGTPGLPPTFRGPQLASLESPFASTGSGSAGDGGLGGTPSFSSGPAGTPGFNNPPATTPPSVTPPATVPPITGVTPPTTTPPPSVSPPSTVPPIADVTPPTTNPPSITPPSTVPPIADVTPPTTNPPSVTPPSTVPPVVNANPPVTDTAGPTNTASNDPLGKDPLHPILPTSKDGDSWHLPLTSCAGGCTGEDWRYFDPPVAVGFRYEMDLTSPNGIAKIKLPILNGGLYDLFLFDGTNWVDSLIKIAGGIGFDLIDAMKHLDATKFGTLLAFLESHGLFDEVKGLYSFEILGIDPNLALNPDDHDPFITGLLFAGDVTGDLTITPLTINTDLPNQDPRNPDDPPSFKISLVTPVPEPGSLALFLSAGVALVAAGRRRRRQAAA
jgi:hypothetical protein